MTGASADPSASFGGRADCSGTATIGDAPCALAPTPPVAPARGGCLAFSSARAAGEAVAEGAADEGATKAGVAATHGLLHAEPSADDRFPEPEASSSGFEGRHSGEAIGEKRSYDVAIGSAPLVPFVELRWLCNGEATAGDRPWVPKGEAVNKFGELGW